MALDLGTLTVELDTDRARTELGMLNEQLDSINDYLDQLRGDVSTELSNLREQTGDVGRAINEVSVTSEVRNIRIEADLIKNELITNELQSRVTALTGQNTLLRRQTEVISRFVENATVHNYARLYQLNRDIQNQERELIGIVNQSEDRLNQLESRAMATQRMTESVYFKGATMMNSVMIALVAFSDVLGETATQSLNVMVASLSTALSAFQIMAANPALAPFAVPAAIAIGSAIFVATTVGMSNVQRQVNAVQSTVSTGLNLFTR